MSQQAQYKKDPMILTKATKRETNAEGKLRVQLSLEPNQVASLIEALQAQLASPRGVKLDVHVKAKEYQGRTFDSGFFFVKPIEAPGAGGFGGAGGAASAAFPSTPTKGFLTADDIKAKTSTAAKSFG
jgi:hypothetical protein